MLPNNLNSAAHIIHKTKHAIRLNWHSAYDTPQIVPMQSWIMILSSILFSLFFFLLSSIPCLSFSIEQIQERSQEKKKLWLASWKYKSIKIKKIKIKQKRGIILLVSGGTWFKVKNRIVSKVFNHNNGGRSAHPTNKI